MNTHAPITSDADITAVLSLWFAAWGMYHRLMRGHCTADVTADGNTIFLLYADGVHRNVLTVEDNGRVTFHDGWRRGSRHVRMFLETIQEQFVASFLSGQHYQKESTNNE